MIPENRGSGSLDSSGHANAFGKNGQEIAGRILQFANAPIPSCRFILKPTLEQFQQFG
jgi:hypothetical protein